MYHIFEGLSSLKSINLSNFNSAKLDDISYMFSGCNSIESIDLSNFDNSLLVNMSHIFEGYIFMKTIKGYKLYVFRI